MSRRQAQRGYMVGDMSKPDRYSYVADSEMVDGYHQPIVRDGQRNTMAYCVSKTAAQKIAAALNALRCKRLSKKQIKLALDPMTGDSRCGECGQVNAVWFTDSETWNRLHSTSGVVCLNCFVKREQSETVVWKLTVDQP